MKCRINLLMNDDERILEKYKKLYEKYYVEQNWKMQFM